MLSSRQGFIIWAPRIVGLGLAFFLGLFAADVFIENRSLLGTLVGFGMHLIPAIVVLALVLIGWSHEGIAAACFLGLALFYTATTREQPGWIVVIAGPLALLSALYLYSWRFRKHRSSETG